MDKTWVGHQGHARAAQNGDLASRMPPSTGAMFDSPVCIEAEKGAAHMQVLVA